MKIKSILSGIVSLAILFGAADAVAQAPINNGGNPGIVMSGSQNYSQLPSKARSFIEKHFKNIGVRSCEKYFAKGKYEVELLNGIDIEFNSKGEVTEIDAADNTTLPATVVKDVMHHKAYSRLEKDGLVNNVESIEFNRKKVCSVELSIPDPDTYLFDVNGMFIALED